MTPFAADESSSLPLPERWDLMLREVKAAISAPSADHPAARIWKASDLVSEIARTAERRAAELTKTFVPAKDVIARMEAIGWIQPLPLSHITAKTRPDLYLVDMEATADSLPAPAELLQGYEPRGVISYFSALELHELTTQTAAFHHIGRLKTYPLARKAPPRPTASNSDPSPATGRPPRDPLGSRCFDYQGLPCYTTQRDRSLAPGIQTRILGPRTQLRVTTLEQTLLDSLFHPQRCGGESVVFEAWENGSTRWDEKRFESHLAAIARDDLERRVGALLELIRAPVRTPELRDRLASRRQSWKETSSQNEPIPLLNGMAYTRLEAEWGVLLP